MILALIISSTYLLGAVPFGLLIGFAKKTDIRRLGSGNIGATNVGRVLGKPWGLLCLALDLLKGFVPTFLVCKFWLQGFPSVNEQLGLLGIGAAAVLGHVFPVYLGFRGGKGVATTIGVALGIYPYLAIPMTATLVAYALARYSTGFVSLGSIAVGVVFPLAFLGFARYEHWSLIQVWPFQAATVLFGLLILIRHRSNIVRILRGQESKVGAPVGARAETDRSQPR